MVDKPDTVFVFTSRPHLQLPEFTPFATNGSNKERLHLELEISRVVVRFIVLTRPNILLFLNAQSVPSF